MEDIEIIDDDRDGDVDECCIDKSCDDGDCVDDIELMDEDRDDSVGCVENDGMAMVEDIDEIEEDRLGDCDVFDMVI